MTTESARPSLHAILMPIPLVLCGVSFVFDVVSFFGGAPFVEAALFNLVAGVAAMVAAGVVEARRYFSRLPPGSSARRIARWQALANVVAAALFVASLWLRWPARGTPATPRVPFVLSALGVAVLGVAGYLGGLVDWAWAATRSRRSPDDR